jgi:hypothetical protein
MGALDDEERENKSIQTTNRGRQKSGGKEFGRYICTNSPSLHMYVVSFSGLARVWRRGENGEGTKLPRDWLRQSLGGSFVGNGIISFSIPGWS